MGAIRIKDRALGDKERRGLISLVEDDRRRGCEYRSDSTLMDDSIIKEETGIHG